MRKLRVKVLVLLAVLIPFILVSEKPAPATLSGPIYPFSILHVTFYANPTYYTL